MAKPVLNRVPLGRTGLMVTPICFGASGLGDMPDTYGYGVDEDRAKATVGAIFDGPVNFLDTSRIYGFGRSEERIGDGHPRARGLAARLCHFDQARPGSETNLFDAGQARRSLEESLKALGLERIDLLHLHDPEHARSPDEADQSRRRARRTLPHEGGGPGECGRPCGGSGRDDDADLAATWTSTRSSRITASPS